MKIAFNPSTVAALIAPPNNKDITFDLRGRNIFARGVKFCGTDTNTWRDIKINNVSIGSNTLDLRNGSNTTLTNTNGVVTINSTWRPVVDNLTSNSTTSSLSAKQGKILKSLIDGKSNSDHTHDGRYLRWNGSTANISAMDWGTLTAANGYTILSHAASSDGGDMGFVNKGGQIFMLLDGYYYLKEGKYRVLDTSDFTTFSNIGSLTTRITIGGITKDLKIDADLLDGWHLDSIRKNVGYSWSAKYRINNWSRIIKIDNYSNILLAINFSQNSQASNHLYLISTGFVYGNIVQLGANGYKGNSAIKIRLTENTATSHNVEIYSTYGYNGATELSINCNYTRIDGNSTITTYLTYTAGGGTVRKEITSSYSKIVANLQGNSDTTTKLQTARKIWGQPFDGTRDVSGFMLNVKGFVYGVGPGEDWSDGNNTHPWYGIDYRHCVDSSETGKAYTSISSYFGLYFKTGGSRFIFDGGNVGIGTNAPAYKLDVRGDIRATGLIIREALGLAWVNGRRGALLRETTSTGYHTLWSLKTTNGSWDFGEYNSSGWNNIPVLSYITDTNFNSGNNTTTYQIKFPLDSGTIALTKDVLTFSNETADYLSASFNNPDFSKKAASKYIECWDGSGGWWNWMAGKFMKAGSSDAYVLLGGGGHKPLSEFLLGNGSYLPYNGWWASGSGLDVNDANGMIFAYTNHKNSPFSSAWGIITTFDYTYNSAYKFLLAANGYSNAMYYRSRSNDGGGWTSWALVIDTGNISSLRVAYATSAGSVAWNNVTGRPTKVSQFINDSGYITSSGSCSYATSAGNADTIKIWEHESDDAWYYVTWTPLNGTGYGSIYESTASLLYNPSLKTLWTGGGLWASLYVKAASIRLENTNEINSYSGDLCLNHRNTASGSEGHTANIKMCGTGGNVIIGANDVPSYLLDVRGSVIASSWLRTRGNSGWFSESYGGGIYMVDTSWVRTYNGKGFYCDNLIYSSYSIKMGNILLEHNDEINNSANGGLHLNYRNTGNVSLCCGGGNVGIGTNAPAYKLDVNGLVRASGFHHASHNDDSYVLLAGGGTSHIKHGSTYWSTAILFGNYVWLMLLIGEASNGISVVPNNISNPTKDIYVMNALLGKYDNSRHGRYRVAPNGALYYVDGVDGLCIYTTICYVVNS